MDLKQKVTLKQKGERSVIPFKNIRATLRWKASVDLDLHAYYRVKPDRIPLKTSWLGKLFGGQEKPEGHVYFFRRGQREQFPWMYLDKDAGIGDQGGDNQENLYFTDLSCMAHVLIAANIFNKPNANFASFDGKVTLLVDGREYEVPLIESAPGSYCVIAHIDLTGPQAELININRTQSHEPNLSEFLSQR